MDNLDEHNLTNDLTNQDAISPIAKSFLNRASGWVKAVAILGIVGASLGILLGLFAIIGSPVIGIINLAIYAFAIYVSILLLKVANNIDRGTFNLDEFAKNFYLYWKTVVIFSLVAVGLTVLMGIIFAVAGVGMLNSAF